MRDWLLIIRKKKGMQPKQIAEAAGISPQAYWYIETGARNPSVETAKKIAKVLKFKWTKFFE